MSDRLNILSSHLATKPAVTVCVTGGSGNIAYSLLPLIGRGIMLGTDQPIHLRVLDIPQAEQALQGVAMELQDCAFPLLRSVTASINAEQMFSGADIIIFLGGLPRKQGMERKDLISINTRIYKQQGEILNNVAKPTTRCLVVANPANTNCLALMKAAPKIPPQNFSCLTRLDQNRAISQVAEKANAQVLSIKGVIIWGNHSSTLYPDVNQATIGKQSVRQFLNDDLWVNSEFINKVQQRGAEIIKARKHSSAMSAASAAADHVRDWLLGTGETWVSMGVISDGSYGVPLDIVYSFPVVCEKGEWRIVQGVPLDKFSVGKADLSAKELLEERKAGLGYQAYFLDLRLGEDGRIEYGP